MRLHIRAPARRKDAVLPRLTLCGAPRSGRRPRSSTPVLRQYRPHLVCGESAAARIYRNENAASLHRPAIEAGLVLIKAGFGEETRHRARGPADNGSRRHRSPGRLPLH